MQYFGTIINMTEWARFIFRQTIQYHSNPSLCPATNAEEAEIELFYEHLQHLLEPTPKNEHWKMSFSSQGFGMQK